MNAVGEYGVLAWNIKVVEKCHDTGFPVLLLCEFHHRLLLRDVGADADGPFIGELSDLLQQFRRRVERWRVRTSHKREQITLFVSRNNLVDMAKGLIRCFCHAVRNHFPRVHDSSGKYGTQPGISYRGNGFECALRVRIEKIVLAKGRDAALNGFDATWHRPGIEVLRPKDLRRA